MDWSRIDWAVVLATFVGPIVAVIITLWHQERSERHRGRRELFTTMMRVRRHGLSPEFVGALNLVPVHFYNSPVVLQHYTELMATFEDEAWQSPSLEARQRLHDKASLRVARLLSAMSKAVKTPIEQLDILKGAYAPQGWADEEQSARETREALKSLLTGQRHLPITIWQAPPQGPAAPPMGEQGPPQL